MNWILNIIQEVLTKIEDEGYEAYVVGGFVRDYYINKQSMDIDVCTSAEPKDIKKIFTDIIQDNEQYGNIVIKYKYMNIDITTYRQELEYDNNRRPNKIKYVETLKEDLLRRDFTINTLCMDKDLKIIDLYHGQEDIDNKIIRVVGNPNAKMYEDPLRILRCIRFATTLGFDIDTKTIDAIEDHKQFIYKVSSSRKKAELDKIFASNNNSRGIDLINKLNLTDILDLSGLDKIVVTNNYLGIWCQIDNCDSVYPFTKDEINIIIETKKLLTKDINDNYVLYNHSIAASLIAAEINNINKNNIIEKYSMLPIKSKKDINITGDQICDILDLTDKKQIREIYQDLEKNIVLKNLNNYYNDIKKYIIKKYK